jgi:hypothetical protein
MNPASRVIIVGFDGLRPDLVGPATTPHIASVLARGMRFANSRSVFPSETRVATPSFSTGCRPASHGLVANSLFDATLGHILNTKHPEAIAALTEAHGALLARPSLGARLAAHGRELAAVWTGTIGAAAALFPDAEALGGIRWNPDVATPEAARLAQGFPPPPPAAVPNTARVRHAGRFFVERVLPRGAAVSVFWSSEPDVSFHYAGIGHPTSMQALREADAVLGEVLEWVAAQPDADGIVVAVMSDHGHVTGESRVPLAETFAAGGFPVARDLAQGGIALGGGGAPGLWLSDRTRVPLLAEWLMAQPWVQLVLARDPAHLPGVLPLAPLGALHDRSPDLAFTFAGGPEADRFGLPGRALIEAADVPEGGGMHGGLHHRELATLLGFAGADIPADTSDTPCDLTDIVPSVMALLGLPVEGCDGVGLVELSGTAPPPFARATLAAHGGRGLHLFNARGRTYPDQAG